MTKRANGRPKSKKSMVTAFGRFLASRKLTYAEVAAALGTTRSYVNQLACGTNPAGPSFKLICAIRDYARAHGGNVPPSSWE